MHTAKAFCDAVKSQEDDFRMPKNRFVFPLCDWLWVLCEFCLQFTGVLFRAECLMD